MIPEQVRRVVAEIDQSLLPFIPGDNAPKRNQYAISDVDRLLHMRWMCAQISDFLERGSIEKAMRWLGFLQGACWVMNIASIETMKRANMAPDTTFDAERK